MVGLDGKSRALHSGIDATHVVALQRAIIDRQVALALEIGCANGVSTLAMLEALESRGEGHLYSVDPAQRSHYDGAGIMAVANAGLADRHTLVEDYDYFALPTLLRRGLRFDFVYIDGWHTFDHVLLDLFFSDKLLKVGGTIAFNDVGMPAVRRATRFLTSHRHYVEVDVGLGPYRYAAATKSRSVVRRALRWPASDLYFRKVDDWEPDWNFYERF